MKQPAQLQIQSFSPAHPSSSISAIISRNCDLRTLTNNFPTGFTISGVADNQSLPQRDRIHQLPKHPQYIPNRYLNAVIPQLHKHPEFRCKSQTLQTEPLEIMLRQINPSLITAPLWYRINLPLTSPVHFSAFYPFLINIPASKETRRRSVSRPHKPTADIPNSYEVPFPSSYL